MFLVLHSRVRGTLGPPSTSGTHQHFWHSRLSLAIIGTHQWCSSALIVTHPHLSALICTHHHSSPLLALISTHRHSSALIVTHRHSWALIGTHPCRGTDPRRGGTLLGGARGARDSWAARGAHRWALMGTGRGAGVPARHPLPPLRARGTRPRPGWACGPLCPAWPAWCWSGWRPSFGR